MTTEVQCMKVFCPPGRDSYAMAPWLKYQTASKVLLAFLLPTFKMLGFPSAESLDQIWSPEKGHLASQILPGKRKLQQTRSTNRPRCNVLYWGLSPSANTLHSQTGHQEVLVAETRPWSFTELDSYKQGPILTLLLTSETNLFARWHLKKTKMKKSNKNSSFVCCSSCEWLGFSW